MRKTLLPLLILFAIQLNGQIFTTEPQRIEVADRIVNGWVDPDGDFPDIVVRVNTEAAAYRSNPIPSRYTNADTNIPSRTGFLGNLSQEQQFDFAPQLNHNPEIYYPFSAAKKGWAMQDATDANALFEQMHWNSQQPEFDFGDTVRFPRNTLGDQFPYTLMGNYFRQWITWYDDYIKIYETISTPQQRAEIDAWIVDLGDWSSGLISHSVGISLGSNWENVTDDSYIFSIGWTGGNASVLYDLGGNQLTEYDGTSQAAFIGNNRFWGTVGLAHVAAIYNKDQAKRNAIVQMWKNYFKWSIFPNGVPQEVDRNAYPNLPDLFLGYFHEIMQGLSEIAFREEAINYNGFISANGWPWESLYEYSTLIGGVNGQVIGNGRVWNGGSTTDGVTQKGLRLMVEAGVKFLEGSFDLYTSAGLKINSANKRFPSSYGIANTYYNNSRIRSAEYLIDADGMPSGPPSPIANQPTLSGVFGSTNFPLGYIGMGGKVFTQATPTTTTTKATIRKKIIFIGN